MGVPDLSGPRRRAESVMADLCLILRNPDGTRDATVDRDTGQLVDDAPVEVYAGVCSVHETSSRMLTEGGQIVDVGDHVLLLPWDAPAVRAGDVVDLVASTNPELTNATFMVRGVEPRTHSVVRRVVVARDEQGSGVPGG